jgi:lysophospholipase L1-like esterase
MKKLLKTALLLISISAPLLIAKELPKVLIIGDSISIGYTPFVAKALKDQAIVIHHKGNAQHTGTGLQLLEEWLGKTKWDLIHFNWGLWDLCYRHPDSKIEGKRDKINGTITTSLEQYEQNLEALVDRLKKTSAKLIWAHTSHVPEGEPGRFVGDDHKYNEIAARVMKKNGIEINDLHSLTKNFSTELFLGPGDVHYTETGYARIAGQVTEKISEKLKK